MMRKILCGNAASTAVVISSPTPRCKTGVTMKDARENEVSPGKMAENEPRDGATHSVVTTSTGIDDSHASRYMAIFQQTNRGDKVPGRSMQHAQTTDHDSYKYIETVFKIPVSVKATVRPSSAEKADIHCDDEYSNDLDICLMNDGTAIEECNSTNALILTDNFSASEAYTDSRHSSITDDIHIVDSIGDSTVDTNELAPPMNRISALTEAIAMKQSDIAVQFCSMIQRMKCIVENMDEMQNSNNLKEMRVKSPHYIKECQILHKTAAKMAKKQVLLAHQSTKYVERLEQEMLDLQSYHERLQSSEKMLRQKSVSDVTLKQALLATKNEVKPEKVPLDHEHSERISEARDYIDDGKATFCIREISFCNSMEVDVLGVVDDEIKETDSDGSGCYLDSGNTPNLRFIL